MPVANHHTDSYPKSKAVSFSFTPSKLEHLLLLGQHAKKYPNMTKQGESKGTTSIIYLQVYIYH
jgi:hypothetical protein